MSYRFLEVTPQKTITLLHCFDCPHMDLEIRPQNSITCVSTDVCFWWTNTLRHGYTRKPLKTFDFCWCGLCEFYTLFLSLHFLLFVFLFMETDILLHCTVVVWRSCFHYLALAKAAQDHRATCLLAGLCCLQRRHRALLRASALSTTWPPSTTATLRSYVNVLLSRMCSWICLAFIHAFIDSY